MVVGRSVVHVKVFERNSITLPTSKRTSTGIDAIVIHFANGFMRGYVNTHAWTVEKQIQLF